MKILKCGIHSVSKYAFKNVCTLWISVLITRKQNEYNHSSFVEKIMYLDDPNKVSGILLDFKCLFYFSLIK